MTGWYLSESRSKPWRSGNSHTFERASKINNTPSCSGSATPGDRLGGENRPKTGLDASKKRETITLCQTPVNDERSQHA